MPNRLAEESSPYLLQHRDNPVDWHPWSPEVLRLAGERDQPLLISIGYSACHWCHVMERESFEDEKVAAYMNDHFIPVKVDREERPDVDAIYMEAVQLITGQGGWPLTAFCSPDGVPFFGGTYFPPEPRPGMPSFLQVMEAVVDAWQNKRERIDSDAAQIRERLGAVGRLEANDDLLRAEDLDTAVGFLRNQADMQNGGFGGPPKFPPASSLELLLARGVHDAPEVTLDRMAAGGIYDHVGGGFARYSVDGFWLVPHFEKMLYDNALLARVYLHGFQALGHERYRRVCCETLDWALREIRGPEGGFMSALDADSEGVEGKFYVWTPAGLREILGDVADDVMLRFGVTERGSFEGASILHLPGGVEDGEPEWWPQAREQLYDARAKRIWPGLDDKRLTAWNALMVGALADAGAVLERADYLEAARSCARFLLEEMRAGDGRLLRTWKDGRGRLAGYLEDHAFAIEALITLYEGTFEPEWFEAAQELADLTIEHFSDSQRGGFFTTADDHEELIVRRKDLDDHPIPSGNSSMALGLLRLGALTGEHRYREQAEGVLRMLGTASTRHPQAFSHLLRAVDLHLGPSREVALVGDDVGRLASVVRAELRPRTVVAGGPEGTMVPPLMRDRPAVAGAAAAYVCEQFTCKAPTTDPAELIASLSGS